MSQSVSEITEETIRLFGRETVAAWDSAKRIEMGVIVNRHLEEERIIRMKLWRESVEKSLGNPEVKIQIADTCNAFSDTQKAQDHDSFLAQESQLDPSPAWRIHDTERDYLDYCKTETGLSCTDEKQNEITHRARILEKQSHSLAERLESQSIPAYRQTPFGVYRYAIHSRTLEKIPAFRRICLLPYIANALRGPAVSALEYFLERRPFCRFWTFTTGPRVAVENLRETVKALHRKISRLNAAPFMQEAGLEIVFRSTEFGTPEHEAGSGGEIERDEKGRLLLHPHAHCVVYPAKGYIPPKKWKTILEKVWEFWGNHWDDGHGKGAICNARECCKYVTKPGEMLRLSSPELADLFHATTRLKLIQPMGRLAQEIVGRKEKGLRLRKAKTPEGYVSSEVKDWNKHPRRSAAEKDMDAIMKLSQKPGQDCLRVLSRSVPSFAGSGLKEPRVFVMATRWNEDAVRKIPIVAELIAETADEYAAGLYIRVHTCTSTVRTGDPPETESQRLMSVS